MICMKYKTALYQNKNKFGNKLIYTKMNHTRLFTQTMISN